MTPNPSQPTPNPALAPFPTEDLVAELNARVRAGFIVLLPSEDTNPIMSACSTSPRAFVELLGLVHLHQDNLVHIIQSKLFDVRSNLPPSSPSPAHLEDRACPHCHCTTCIC